MISGQTISLAMLVGLALVFGAAPAAMAQQKGEADSGKKIYEKKKCDLCHLIAGKGKPVPGPDLTKQGTRNSSPGRWRWIRVASISAVSAPFGEEDDRCLRVRPTRLERQVNGLLAFPRLHTLTALEVSAERHEAQACGPAYPLVLAAEATTSEGRSRASLPRREGSR
jgi:hypothetical protein